MYLVLLLTFMSLMVQAATTKEIEEAKKSIRALIQPIMPHIQKKSSLVNKQFRLDGCEKFEIDWLSVLTLKKDVTLNYKFKEGCDIEGVLTPKVLQPFAMSFSLRHLEAYTKIEGQNKITASIESKPIVYLEIRTGVLTGNKGKVYFEADYQFQINPLADAKPLEKDLGGELRISEIFGEKVTIKEKISVAK